MVARIEEDDWNGPHKDDDGEPCNCTSQECAYTKGESVCPACGHPEHTLVHGDHGFRCDSCKETFTCP